MSLTVNDEHQNSRLPLLFMHGFACGKEDWAAVTAQLRPHYRTLAFDFPGHGAPHSDSGRLRESDWTIRWFAADAIKRIDAFGAEPVVLVGHSLGCRVALEIAATIPDRIAGIILIEASMAASGDPLSARRLTDQFIAEQGFASFLEIRFGEMFLCKNDQYYSILARAKLIDPEGGSALFASQAAWDAGFMERRLSDVKAPLLYIQSMYFDKSGKRRPVSEGCDSPWLDFVASVTPHARIELVTGSGHFPHIEQPEAIVKLIEDFLDSL